MHPDIPEILPPNEDGVFKTLLTHPDATGVLADVIRSILEIPVVEATVVNAELPIDDIAEKRERFDINCKLDDGGQADVEMQSSAMESDKFADGHPQIRHRSVYNLCDLHAKQDGRGTRYQDLLRSFQITFCGYKVFDDEPFLHRFRFRDERGLELANAVEIVFVELPKVQRKDVQSMTDAEMWAAFFAHANDPQYRDVMDALTHKKEAIQMATNVLKGISQDERQRAHFRSRRMFEMDMDSNRISAEMRGEARGKAEVLQQLLDMGLLTEEQTKQLRL